MRREFHGLNNIDAIRARFDELMRQVDRRHRRPPEAGMQAPAIPPRGPLPKQGGAEAPLEFD